MSHDCYACERSYSTKHNLMLHHQRQPLCVKWIECIPESLNYEIIKKMVEDKEVSTKCCICEKEYTTTSNLLRYYNNNLVCKKWLIFKDIQNLKPLFEKDFKPFDNSNDKPSGVSKYTVLECNVTHRVESLRPFRPDSIEECNCDGMVLDKFEAPAYKLNHIIWNVFLIDKETKLTEEIVKENNVGYIIAILPDPEIYKEKIKVNVDYTVMQYNGHEPLLDYPRFAEECDKIEAYRKERKNVFVFCNNGYQRSIPFLCYYLTKFHGDEVPTLEKAIDIILPQVDKENYANIRNPTINSMRILFKKENE